MTSARHTTYLVRHARTAYSARHVVNGSLKVDVPLDAAGTASCHALSAPWLDTVATCVTSGFTRTRQTAHALLGDRHVVLHSDHRLDEIDYGVFEGGPWTRYGDWLAEAGRDATPPGAGESWSGAVARMLSGLSACLEVPGPRLVVGHGLLGSVVRWLMTAPPGERLSRPFLPEAPCLEPVVLDDDELTRLLSDAGERLGLAAVSEAAGR
ncbi:histidine phosphatase family protein [Streptomyces sp. NRRL B-24085]|uniref:histidine phosphatase family protein n=1 Tax=Streptomyces sp. NRRL B-24085 TaxID=1709476 RepID=UPI0006B331AE|nr:histidine phosphatase family protein [Streptomyces sp. NRRL B-24085]